MVEESVAHTRWATPQERAKPFIFPVTKKKKIVAFTSQNWTKTMRKNVAYSHSKYSSNKTIVRCVNVSKKVSLGFHTKVSFVIISHSSSIVFLSLISLPRKKNEVDTIPIDMFLLFSFPSSIKRSFRKVTKVCDLFSTRKLVDGTVVF